MISKDYLQGVIARVEHGYESTKAMIKEWVRDIQVSFPAEYSEAIDEQIK